VVIIALERPGGGGGVSIGLRGRVVGAFSLTRPKEKNEGSNQRAGEVCTGKEEKRRKNCERESGKDA